MRDCPCGTGASYQECCGRWHAGAPAPTAEQLMRSRFAAFAVGDESYLLRTWHPRTRPATIDLDATLRWYRLDVLRTERGGPFDDDGVVEFRASFRSPAGAGEMHEVSRFTRDAGRWYYLDGTH